MWLALDVLEIFRSSVDLFATNRLAELTPESFYYRETEGCRLSKAARPLFYREWAILAGEGVGDGEDSEWGWTGGLHWNRLYCTHRKPGSSLCPDISTRQAPSTLINITALTP
ncbi:CRISPR-associated endonuclease Cas1 [Thiothrix nivea]|uniref:Uncharacterized protein n=1 Tax=Thiothrix nivea (strain ATCC 35100 / DSM 5205 / JP2) TaxID=870187 RepID=A0A656HGM6_THINJ|nr:CRISPR-associated endonuclease Cas1 [Thiothrix nivea]EIJ36058.1 hypothetical protein Thini_3552 [Thiothrix nivea DSM 5205]